MSNPTPDASPPATAKATHEFRLEAAARDKGLAYLRYRDGDIFNALSLGPPSSVVYIGRDDSCIVQILHDVRVSRRHARLIFGAGAWSIEDGPSRNGTFVDGRRTVGEQILADGSLITVGRTTLSFVVPIRPVSSATLTEDAPTALLHPNDTQRRVLAELVRPFIELDGATTAPTNAAIAAMLGYQVTTIRDAISALYHQAGLARGASDQRAELIRIAIAERTVTADDLA